MIPVAKIAASGWFIIGVPIKLPKVPTLLIVNVLPFVSSPFNLLSRAFPTSSFVVSANSFKFFLSAFLTTGTIKFPEGSAVAIPIFISSFTMIFVPSRVEFIIGKSVIAFATHSINSGVNVSFSLYFF